MATYTHSTAARYTNSKYRQHNTRDDLLTRAATKLLSRLRPTTAASANAKRLFGSGWPEFGNSLGTAFVPATGAVSRTYRKGTTALGGKARTR